MTSLLVIFRAFLFIFFRLPDPISPTLYLIKKSRTSTNKKILALVTLMLLLFQSSGIACQITF